VTVRFTVDARRAIAELHRLAFGTASIVPEFESILATSYAATQAQVHVITGLLKASGHPTSQFDGETWEGVIHYARRPGIFELARGNQPTLNHPDGAHFFFDAAYHTADAYERAFEDFLGGHVAR
jgi:hypothetical protein